MTRQLYYEDVYLKEFDAEVTRCFQSQDGYHIYVDRSAFFPEGGGQSGDRGVLTVTTGSLSAEMLLCRPDADAAAEYAASDTTQCRQKEDAAAEDAARENTAADDGKDAMPGRIEVKDTRLDGDDIYLVCDRELPAGTKIHGTLDWQFRFDRMQNHSGEHIVSGIIHRRYGFDNKGFHMSPDRMTIDLSGEIPAEDLADIEREANGIVWQDVPVITDVYTEEEAEQVEFRSKKELHGSIRVVTIPGADVCACCGTHVRRTGEIGPVRIISHERFRGGSRLELMCGRWAYEYMSSVFLQNQEVSRLVSARPLQTASYVERHLGEEAELKSQLVRYNYERIDEKARQLENRGNVLIFAEAFSPVLVQKLAAKVMETCGGICIAMSGTDENGCRYAAGQKNGDLKDLVRAMNAALGGRGGGKPFFQQGSISASREETERFLKMQVDGLTVEEM